MTRYRILGNGIYDNDNSIHMTSPGAPGWAEYQEWLIDPLNIPDPENTPEEQAQIDYNERQDARTRQLKQALIMQFKMILALFQVGRDKGLWVVGDFDADLVTQAQAWIDLIDDYENDSP